MDFKIELVCNKCKCAFELRPTDFRERTSMECPNCGQTFPSGIYSKLKSGIYSKLKSGIVLLGEIPEVIKEDEDYPLADTLFTAHVKSFDALHDLFGGS